MALRARKVSGAFEKRATEREFGNILLAPQTGPPAKILIKKVNAQLI